MRIWEDLIPWVVIDHFNRAVVLRLGKFLKVLEPGFHWKVPFFDAILHHSVVVSTLELESQSLTTRDDKGIVAKGVVKYQISDIKVFELEVYDAHDGMADMTQGIIKEVLMERSWDECRSPEIDNIITKKARVEARKWGIEIIKVTLTDLGIIRSIRLFNGHLPQTSSTS